MSRIAPLMLALTLGAAACSGGSDPESTPTGTAAVATDSVPETEPEPTTTETTTTTSTTIAPTTTLDEAALLAEAEAAYLEAFEVGNAVLRNPNDPDNRSKLEEHFTGPNLDAAIEDLRRAVDGGFVAVASESNPSFAVIIDPAEFVAEEPNVVRMTVCEFYSDQIFEVGTAPDGGNSLRRDDPVSILITARMERVDGTWKSHSGTRGEEIRDEVARCDDAF